MILLCEQFDLLIDWFELLYLLDYMCFVNQVWDDFVCVLLYIDVWFMLVMFYDLWDFEEVYVMLYDYVCVYLFDFEYEDYLIYIMIGMYVVQICWFLFVEVCYLFVCFVQMGLLQ